jgi:hypothetical protein
MHLIVRLESLLSKFLILVLYKICLPPTSKGGFVANEFVFFSPWPAVRAVIETPGSVEKQNWIRHTV